MAEKKISLRELLQKAPHARARVKGSQEYPQIEGKVDFFQTDMGVMVMAEMRGLPMAASACDSGIFGFHIHQGEECKDNGEDSFAAAGMHYNPGNCQHPAHAGDLPPLLGNKGYALQIFLTDRFTVEEIIGRTVIIHAAPDDFTSQPAGNAGKKIACGKIKPGVY